jgi:CBS domain-containing protein
LTTAVGLLRRHRIGSLPVMKNGKLAGIVTRSDILDFVLSGAGIKLPKRKAMRPRAAKTK